MNVPIGDPKAPGIAGALDYLAARYGVSADHIRNITITGGVNQPTVITVALIVQGDEPARDETVRFEPGCLCPRNAAGRVGTDPRCPMHQPGGPGLQDARTEVTAAPWLCSQLPTCMDGEHSPSCAVFTAQWDGEQLGGR